MGGGIVRGITGGKDFSLLLLGVWRTVSAAWPLIRETAGQGLTPWTPNKRREVTGHKLSRGLSAELRVKQSVTVGFTESTTNRLTLAVQPERELGF